MAVDVRALETELPDAAIKLLCRLVWRLDRQGGEASKALRVTLDRLGEEVVGIAGARYGVNRLNLLDARRIERKNLHIDAGGIHLGNALVAYLKQSLDDQSAIRPRIFETVNEALARALGKCRRYEVFFDGDGSHDCSLLFPQ
jgi:hypothetical protein